MKRSIQSCCILALLALMQLPAAAGFLGKDVHLDYLFPDTSSLYEDEGTVNVGPGPEWNVFGLVSVDLSDSQIMFSGPPSGYNYTSTPFNGYSFFDVFAEIDPIASITVNPATNFPGFDSSRVSWTDDGIQVNFQGLSAADNATVVLDVQFGSGVPEPSTLVLSGLPLVAFGLSRLRRR